MNPRALSDAERLENLNALIDAHVAASAALLKKVGDPPFGFESVGMFVAVNGALLEALLDLTEARRNLLCTP